MTKAILFDVDGLVIEKRKEFFSERFAREQGIDPESVRVFFTTNFKKCSFGKSDLKEELMPWLAKWDWQGSVEDFLTYWFESESKKDEAVLEVVAAIRSKGIDCYIATRQEKYRLAYLLKTVGLKEYFDGAFCSCEIEFDKNDPKFYEYILNALKLNPSEILFFDDTQANVDTARALGIEAYFYESLGMLKSHTSELLI